MSDGCLERPGTSSGWFERFGAFLFAWRNWVFTGGLLAFLVGFRPAPFLGSWSADLWLNLAGIGMTLLGQGIRVLVIGYAPIMSGGSRKRVAAEALVTTGLLGHVRNPLYVGNLLILFGLTLIHNSPWLYLLLLPAATFGYVAIVAAEEAWLERRFGEAYREYCRGVPRWLPRLSGLSQSLKGRAFDGRRVLLQEYGSLWIAIAFPAGLMLLEGWREPSLQGPRTNTVWGVLVAVTAAWLWLRRLKLLAVARRKAARGPAPQATTQS